jgi:heparan-alpha-glucosaminide N-acetyltransferase
MANTFAPTATSAQAQAAPQAPALGVSSRLRSLDAFRGFDIALMFFVNLSASRAAFPEWFGHAGWNSGLHGQWLADFVFPWFLFIVGCAIPFSMNSGRGQARSVPSRLLVAFRRGLVIYLLGIAVFIAKTAKGPDGTPVTWATFLHWDILPLIGLGYFLGVCAYHLPRWALSAAFLAILVAKWAIMPDLTSGAGLQRAAWMNARTDIEHQIRSWNWFGTLIAQGLPAGATVIGGVLVGEYLRAATSTRHIKALTLIGAGIAITALAYALAAFARMPMSKDFFTPTFVLVAVGSGTALLGLLYGVLDAWNWRRWHLTYLGAAALLLSLAFVTLMLQPWAADASPETLSQWASAAIVLGTFAGILVVWASIDWRLGYSDPATARALVILGSNAIAIYVLAEITWTMVWMHLRVQGPGDFGGQFALGALTSHIASLLQSMRFGDLAKGVAPWLSTFTYIAIYWLAAWWLWRRKIFIKV